MVLAGRAIFWGGRRNLCQSLFFCAMFDKFTVFPQDLIDFKQQLSLFACDVIANNNVTSVSLRAILLDLFI